MHKAMDNDNLKKNLQIQLNDIHLKDIELIEFSHGSCTLQVQIDESQFNHMGIVHGGIIFAICDTCAGATSVTLNEKAVTLNASINYIKSTRSGSIKVVSNTLHNGASTSVIRVMAMDDEDIVLADASFTMYNL